jgi:hypothetical protein
MATLKYLSMTQTNKNYIKEERKANYSGEYFIQFSSEFYIFSFPTKVPKD